jgi:hypothetical protein
VRPNDVTPSSVPQRADERPPFGRRGGTPANGHRGYAIATRVGQETNVPLFRVERLQLTGPFCNSGA